ncbi:MAG: hypothetical protein EBU84_17420 [Actinobacteria bacterium]|nr:hypothetical protein [Actinomycetota bacterium]
MRKIKKVVWNKNPETGGIIDRSLRQRTYVPDVEMPAEVIAKFAPHLYVGALWRVASEYFSPSASDASCEPPPHPYGHGSEYPPYTKIIHKKSTMAIYLGTTRVEEDSRGRSISVPRHTFMIEGNVYLVLRLVDFEPVS